MCSLFLSDLIPKIFLNIKVIFFAHSTELQGTDGNSRKKHKGQVTVDVIIRIPADRMSLLKPTHFKLKEMSFFKNYEEIVLLLM